MIPDQTLFDIVKVITELSLEKKRDFYDFLLEIKRKVENIVDDDKIEELLNSLKNIENTLKNKVDKEEGKGLSTNDFTDEFKNILENLNLSLYEKTENKVTSISIQSTDNQYPSAKCVYDIVGDIESVLNAILGI